MIFSDDGKFRFGPCDFHLIIEEIGELWNVGISGFLEEFS